ncbi:MAG TPA: SGNH/GDSL hydrolase family protein, partial [Nitrospirales bacterium]|nr:SGNH/GDSL hydrolase family protein [Nitrospirales bacterium]
RRPTERAPIAVAAVTDRASDVSTAIAASPLVSSVTLLHWAIFITSLYLAFELLSAGALHLLAFVWNHEYRVVDAEHLTAQQQDSLARLMEDRLEYFQHDPLLGWTIRPYGEGSVGLYHSNGQGVRTSAMQNPTPVAASRVRIAAFGDSFTHGDEVTFVHTWEHQLSEMLPGVEALNFGVPGYGLDQAFLRYWRDGGQFRPDVVIIGFMPENVYRHLNVFRPFYYPDTGVPLTKPRFVIKDGRLTLIPNPLPQIVDYSAVRSSDAATWRKLRELDPYAAWRPEAGPLDRVPSVRLFKFLQAELARRFDERQIVRDGVYAQDGEAFQITETLLREFTRTVSARGAAPVVAIFPEREDVKAFLKDARTRYTPLVVALQRRGIRTLDLMPALLAGNPDPEALFAQDHYSAEGNRRIARALADFLETDVLPTLRQSAHNPT